MLQTSKIFLNIKAREVTFQKPLEAQIHAIYKLLKIKLETQPTTDLETMIKYQNHTVAKNNENHASFKMY